MPLDRQHRMIANWVLVSAVVLLLAFVVGTAVTNQLITRQHQPELEASANLHNIQLSVERYAVDHDGCYPQYLIGGETGSDPNLASDVLLREGYIDSYPRNPFSRPQSQYGGMDVLTMQQRLPFSYYGGDPLRPGCAEGDKYGYRFGNDGSLMGQVLCDARWPTWQREDPATGELTEHHTWADVEYRFWDMWLDPDSKEPSLPFSPGQFFYKSLGPVISFPADYDVEKTPIIRPTEIDQYMLGAYGSLQSKGKDVIGDEQPYTYFKRSGEEELTYWSGTGSELSPDGHAGAPVSGRFDESTGQWLPSTNGIHDGIILVLTAGEDYIGDR